MKQYKDIKFDTYEEMRNFLYKEYGKNKDKEVLKKIKEIGIFVREERDEKVIEFWKNLNKEFKEPIDVPRLNLRDEEYQKYVIPALKRCGAIALKDLEIDHVYLGEWRRGNIGRWDGEQFEVYRDKFGNRFIDKCNHFENDDNYALFVPIKSISKEKFI